MTPETSEWMLWLGAAAQKSPDLSCLLDTQGRLVYLNPTAERFLLDPHLTQMSWLSSQEELTPQESGHCPKILSHLDALKEAAANQGWQGFIKIQSTQEQESHETCLAATLVPLADTSGEITRYHLSAHEVTALVESTGVHITDTRFALMMDLMDDIVSLHDTNFFTLYATPALTRITGLSARQTTGKSVFRWMHSEDKPRVMQTLRRLRRTGEATVRWRHVSRQGACQWLETRIRTLEESWTPTRYLCSTRDIGPQIVSEERVLWRARHDALTELPNRNYFMEQIKKASATLPPEHLLAILFLDLDGFKRINDSLGHETGDTLLRIVAQRLQDTLRLHDMIGRMGGDEFTILLNPIHSADETEILVRRLLAAVARPVLVGGQELFVSASIGVSLYPDDGMDGETLVRHADVAMYQAKQTGNNFRYFDHSMHDATQERLRQERCLRRALEQGEFEMHYQPQMNPRTGEVSSLEALLRWKRPSEEAPISPARFIAVAEECGLIEPLGSWIMQNVCEQAAGWLTENGLSPLIAVNVSTIQLTQPWFLRRVEQTLEATGLPPRLLEMEITESALLGKGAAALKTLEGLHELGIRLAVDDFGTGYSSLSYLRDLPLDCLKIDASFLIDLEAPQTQAIIRAIIELSHALDLEVVAEGVEQEKQRAILADLNCDKIQGFLLSPAIPAAAIPEFLKRQNEERKVVLTLAA
ncbi:putative bifunctional diguanylate cyclase/phosphodiesterase [Armatimonas sp.]|uniref:putative bifunctional diguanylate cyclase/phosphodiesterase n=1 Tax=Armatimonas sp. TaxID=1872638 RepID=UPI003750C08E